MVTDRLWVDFRQVDSKKDRQDKGTMRKEKMRKLGAGFKKHSLRIQNVPVSLWY